MTYWYLLWIAALCAVVAVAAFWVLFGDSFFPDNDLLALAGVAVGTISLVAAALCGVAFTGFNLSRAACVEHGERGQITVRYELLSGCYVDVDGRLVPYDRWVQVSGQNTP